jgi:hypothetical protein
MAKKSKKSKTRTSRRRRVGAIGGDGLKLVLGAVAGAVVAGFASSKLASVDSKIKNAGMVVAGFLLAKNSNPLIKGAALGIAATGGVGLVATTGIMSGAPLLEFGQLSGFNEYPNNPQMNAIAGYSGATRGNEMNVISGITSAQAISAGAGMC